AASHAPRSCERGRAGCPKTRTSPDCGPHAWHVSLHVAWRWFPPGGGDLARRLPVRATRPWSGPGGSWHVRVTEFASGVRHRLLPTLAVAGQARSRTTVPRDVIGAGRGWRAGR